MIISGMTGFHGQANILVVASIADAARIFLGFFPAQ